MDGARHCCTHSLQFPQRLSEQRSEFPWGCLSVNKHTLRSDRDPGDQIPLISPSTLPYIFWLCEKRDSIAHITGVLNQLLFHFLLEENCSRISTWGIRMFKKNRFKEGFMCDGHRNTCYPDLCAAPRPMLLQLFTSGPLGGFQTQRLCESISMWGYLIQAHNNLRPDLDTGPSVSQARSRNEVQRRIQIQGI